MKKVAVFDFDGTLAYASTPIWVRAIPFPKLVWLSLSYPTLNIFSPGFFQKKAFEYLVGRDLTGALRKIRRLPKIDPVVNYFKKLSDEGHRMIVMSYSPGVVVREWLESKGLEAEVICPELIIKDGVVQEISSDDVTKIYLEHINSKKRVLEMVKLKPDISVGDTKKDIVGEKHLHVSELGKIPSKIKQILVAMSL